MNPGQEDRIRRRAYELWRENGSPENAAEHFWLMAEREVAQGGPAAAPPVDPSSESHQSDPPGQLEEDVTGTESGRVSSRRPKVPKSRAT